MNAPSFAQIVGDADLFYRRHFGRRPLHRVAALTPSTCQTESLVSVTDMEGLLRLETFSPTYLRLVRGARTVSTKAFTRVVVQPGLAVTEQVVPEKVFELFRSGATLACNSLDHLLPRVDAITNEIARAFHTTGEAVAFMTPPGMPGLSPHHDPVDVFVLQMSGTKSWTVWDRPDPRERAATFYERELLGKPALEVLLRPGDLLYMPPFVPHCAASLDETSLHIAVSVEPRSWRHLLTQTVASLLSEGFDEFPLLVEDYDGAARAEFAARVGELTERLTALDPAQVFDGFRDLGGVPAGGFEGGMRTPNQ